MAHNKEVVKILETATQFQTELELAQAQHGVLVLDLYNAEWGHCKALTETFRRLYTDAGDDIYIRFYAVECNKVLETLRNPDPHQAAQIKQKQMEYHPDTFPQTWEPILESRQEHSKPFFLYYKEGKIRGQQEGVDTPRIYKFIRGLCVPQKPASDFITNESLMNFWTKYFSEMESEVTANELFRSLVKERNSNDPFTPEQKQAIEVFADAKAGIIHAEGLQKWTGERDFMETVSAVVPDAAAIEPYPEEEEEEDAAAAEAEAGGEGEEGDGEGKPADGEGEEGEHQRGDEEQEDGPSGSPPPPPEEGEMTGEPKAAIETVEEEGEPQSQPAAEAEGVESAEAQPESAVDEIAAPQSTEAQETVEDVPPAEVPADAPAEAIPIAEEEEATEKPQEEMAAEGEGATVVEEPPAAEA